MNNDLDELKKLLFGAEKETLEHIAERVEKRETRAVDVADILPEAIHHSHRNDDGELVESLKDPVGVVIKRSFREQPETYGDALYPVMGPAIRKSIMHTLRTFTQQINQAVEHSLSVKGIRWRLQAWRAGVPFGEFVLQQTLLYRVEQAYLISRENGLLIGHVHHDAAKIKDSDAVSAMFTAIQDFVKESFSPDRTGRLETADMGEFTLWAVHGPHALLVCVIRGLPPRNLRTDLSAILERIHFRHGDALRNYAGDTTSVHGVDDELEQCLRFQAQQERDEKKKSISWPMLVILLIVAALVIAYGVSSYLYARDQARLEAVLSTTAGVYVGELERKGSGFVLHGMRDPLAATIDEVAAEAGIDPDRIEARLQPYQSLDPEIALLRLESALDAPAGVTLTTEGMTLVATGTAPKTWIDEARRTAAAASGSVDLSGVQVSEWLALVAAAEASDGQSFFFGSGTTLTEDSAAALATQSAAIARLAAQAEEMSATLEIVLVGFTDGIGDPDTNARLATERTQVVRQALQTAGVAADTIASESDLPVPGELDLASRRVDMRLALAR